jgi:DNA polymerase I
MVVPPVEELQQREDTKEQWIHYSALDAKATHELYHVLRSHLDLMPCEAEAVLAPPAAAYPEREDMPRYSLWHMYQRYWQPFGDLLTEMEKEGMLVDK